MAQELASLYVHPSEKETKIPDGWVTCMMMAEKWGVSRCVAHQRLRSMVQDGLIKSKKMKIGGHSTNLFQSVKGGGA